MEQVPWQSMPPTSPYFGLPMRQPYAIRLTPLVSEGPLVAALPYEASIPA